MLLLQTSLETAVWEMEDDSYVEPAPVVRQLSEAPVNSLLVVGGEHWLGCSRELSRCWVVAV